MTKLLSEVHIPNYPSKIKVSEARRARYYIKGKTKKKVPKKYDPTIHPTKFFWDSKGYLIEKSTGERVIANPRSVGTPRYWVVNFQDIWNQNLVHSNRAHIINILKDELRPYIKTVKRITEFPIRFEIFLYDIEMRVDVSNKGVVYTKVIEDLLVAEGKIPDDNSTYINDTGRCKFVKINKESERKMVIKIWESN